MSASISPLPEPHIEYVRSLYECPELRAQRLRRIMGQLNDFIDDAHPGVGQPMSDDLRYQIACVRNARMAVEVALISAAEEVE